MTFYDVWIYLDGRQFDCRTFLSEANRAAWVTKHYSSPSYAKRYETVTI